MKILGIVGSLREKSYNLALMKAAMQAAPPELEITLFERMKEIPLFNEDVEKQGDPGPVAEFKRAIGQADALLIAVPEYNYGVSGVLKNAVDWASRPAGKSVLLGKPAGLIGASPSFTGTARAQLGLRQSFTFTQTPVMLQPEFLVGQAHQKFDENGVLVDAATVKRLSEFMFTYRDWIRIVKRAAPGQWPRAA